MSKEQKEHGKKLRERICRFIADYIRRLKRINHLQAKMLERLLNMMLDIGYPCNAEQEKTLQWVCEKYDALFEEISNKMNQVKERW